MSKPPPLEWPSKPSNRLVREDLSTERRIHPTSLPEGWKAKGWNDPVGWLYLHRDGLRVLITTSEEIDSCVWMHVSFSRRNRIPTWNDTIRVKHVFIGSHRKGIVVLPPVEEYVNIHPHCLHLWCNLDADPLPDFRWGNGGI